MYAEYIPDSCWGWTSTNWYKTASNTASFKFDTAKGTVVLANAPTCYKDMKKAFSQIVTDEKEAGIWDSNSETLKNQLTNWGDYSDGLILLMSLEFPTDVHDSFGFCFN